MEDDEQMVIDDEGEGSESELEESEVCICDFVYVK